MRLSVILFHSIIIRRSLVVRAPDSTGMEQTAYILISQILELVTSKFLSGGIPFWCTVLGYVQGLQGLENGAVVKVFIARLNFWSPCKCQFFLRQADSFYSMSRETNHVLLSPIYREEPGNRMVWKVVVQARWEGIYGSRNHAQRMGTCMRKTT